MAWNGPTMSMSMPNIDFTTSSAASQRVQRASLGGEGGFPADCSRTYKKHSGGGKMLSFGVDIGERSAAIAGAGRAGSDLNRTLREQQRDIADKLRDLPRKRMHDSRKSTAG